MSVDQAHKEWTADAFLETDQLVFGDAWRYELVDGRIMAHAAPTPDHGAIASGLTSAIGTRLRSHPERCRPEVGSGAAPKRQQRNSARIPDVMIRCGAHPRVVFEIISASELRNWRARDRKRKDLQDVEGVREIVEIYQAQVAVHVYRRDAADNWTFEAIDGASAILNLASVGISIPLAEIYEFAMPPGEEA